MLINTIKNILLNEMRYVVINDKKITFKKFVRRKTNGLDLEVDGDKKVIFLPKGIVQDRTEINYETGEVLDPQMDGLYELIVEHDCHLLTNDIDNSLIFRLKYSDIDNKLIVRSGEVNLNKYKTNAYFLLSKKRTIDGFSFKTTQNLNDETFKKLSIKLITDSNDGKLVDLSSRTEGLFSSNYVKSQVFIELIRKYVTVYVDDDELFNILYTMKGVYDNCYLINDEGDTFYLFNVKNKKMLEKYDGYKFIKK